MSLEHDRQMPKEIAIIHLDDWQQLYFDGELVAEGHSLSAADLLSYLPIAGKVLDLYTAAIQAGDETLYFSLRNHYSTFEKYADQVRRSP